MSSAHDQPRREFHAIEALARSQDLFSAFMEQLPLAAFLKDPQGRLIYVNTYMDKHFGAGRWIGMTALEYHPPGLAEKVMQDDELVHERGDLVTEDRVPDLDGEERCLHVHKFLIRREGEPPLLGGISLDITELRRAEQERLELTEKMQEARQAESLGLLAGGIAHDFNNLLMAILGNIELARSDLGDIDAVYHSLSEVEQAAQRAAELTRQMLDYSGQGHRIVQPIDLSDLVRTMSGYLSSLVGEEVRLERDLTTGLPAVEADAKQIQQVVEHLVSNAAEAIGQAPGAVRVRTFQTELDAEAIEAAQARGGVQPGVFVCLEVGDTGGGMAPDVLERIFQPFFSTKFTGRGLGMAAVQGIVRGHNGLIRVDNEPGVGTTVRVCLPAVQAEAEATETGEAESTWRGHGLLLFVEDEEPVRRVGRRMLRHLGFDVLTADDGEEALEVYAEHRERIRGVVLDLAMPRMDGEAVMAVLQRQDAGLPVLIASGYSENEIRERLGGLDPAAIIRKPYTIRDLADALQAALGDPSKD